MNRYLSSVSSRRIPWLIVVGVVLLVALIAFLLLHKAGEKAAADAEGVALVTLAKVESAEVRDTAPVFGVVTPSQSGVFTIASPKPAIVVQVLVGPGQAVNAGQPLVVLADAPGARMSYDQAVNARNAAQRDLERVQRMMKDHLATNDQVIAAQKALADANAALVAQSAQGAGKGRQTLTAPFAAVVTAVTGVAGDHVAQDAPIMTLAQAGGSGGGVGAKLSIEPDLSVSVAAGQAVTLTPVFGKAAPITSHIAMVGRQVDATTKSVDALAPLGGAPWPIGSAVKGEIVTGSHSGLVVPRAAVVFDETGTHVFTVAGGRAKRVAVEVGDDQGEAIEVKGALKAGDAVAVEGAYELQNGMEVRLAPVKKAAPEKADAAEKD